MSKPQDGTVERLKRDDVLALVGPLDDGTIAGIIATRTTCADIEQALRLLGCGNDDELEREFTPAAEAVHDMLAADPAFAAPER